MKVIETGHIYELTNREHSNDPFRKGKLEEAQTIIFLNKEHGSQHDGTSTQDVLRVLIDRTRHCANCMPHRNNEQIVYHLRMALVLHEARALERKVEKGVFAIEYLNVGADGHLSVKAGDPGQFDTTELIPHRNDWDRECSHEKKDEI